MRKQIKKSDIVCGILCALIIGAMIFLAIQMVKKEEHVKEYRTLMNEANRYYEEENFETAKDYYLQAIKMDDKQIAPYLKAAAAWQKMGEQQETEKLLAQAEEKFSEEKFLALIEETREKLAEESNVSPDNSEATTGDDATESEEPSETDSEKEVEQPAEWTAFQFPKEQWLKLSRAAAILASFGDQVVAKECSEEQIQEFLAWYFYYISDEEIPQELEKMDGNSQYYCSYSQKVVDRILEAVFGRAILDDFEWKGVKLEDGIYWIAPGDGAAMDFFRYIRAEKKAEQIRVLAEFQTYGDTIIQTRGQYWVSLEEDAESILGYCFQSVEKAEEAEPVFLRAEATSVLESSSAGTYGPENVLDRNPSTAWVEGVSGLGVGESITLYSEQTQKVHGIKILSGYWKNEDILKKNSYPYKYRLEFSDGTVLETDTGTDSYSGREQGFMAWSSEDPVAWGSYKVMSSGQSVSMEELEQSLDLISFGREIETSYIKITILGAQSGSKYEDTCISEVIPY